jgi:tungstate transport system substrate-binding protein
MEGDPRMFNQYGIIAVNPEKHKHVKYRAAMRLIDWITSPSGQQKIKYFTIDGQQVFYPNAEAGK